MSIFRMSTPPHKRNAPAETQSPPIENFLGTVLAHQSTSRVGVGLSNQSILETSLMLCQSSGNKMFFHFRGHETYPSVFT